MRTEKSRTRYFNELGGLLQAIEDNLETLEGSGLKACRDMIAQNIATLAKILNVAVRQTPRDTFIAQGGGWGIGS